MLSFLTDRERSRSSIKVGVVFVGRTGVCVPAMHAVFSCSSQPWSVGLYLFSSRCFFRTLPLAPSGGDRWFYADRKMRVSEYKGSLLALLNENILFKVPKTSAYGRFLNAKRS